MTTVQEKLEKITQKNINHNDDDDDMNQNSLKVF